MPDNKIKELPSTVIVIDDDAAVQQSLGSLLRSVGFEVNLFGSVNEFFKSGRPAGPFRRDLAGGLLSRRQTGSLFGRELAGCNLGGPIRSPAACAGRPERPALKLFDGLQLPWPAAGLLGGNRFKVLGCRHGRGSQPS